MPWIVYYTTSFSGRTQSSVWGLREDAENYAATVRELGRGNVEVKHTNKTPEIFPHCDGALSQAIGGICFGCGKVLTREDAREWARKQQRH